MLSSWLLKLRLFVNNLTPDANIAILINQRYSFLNHTDLCILCSFQKKQAISKKLQAGFLGGVCWTFRHASIKMAREVLGLPSSCIRNTNMSKAEPFIHGLSFNQLIILIFHWVAGDGTIHYYYVNKRTGLSFKYLPLHQETKISWCYFKKPSASLVFKRPRSLDAKQVQSTTSISYETMVC